MVVTVVAKTEKSTSHGFVNDGTTSITNKTGRVTSTAVTTAGQSQFFLNENILVFAPGESVKACVV